MWWFLCYTLLRLRFICLMPYCTVPLYSSSAGNKIYDSGLWLTMNQIRQSYQIHRSVGIFKAFARGQMGIQAGKNGRDVFTNIRYGSLSDKCCQGGQSHTTNSITIDSEPEGSRSHRFGLKYCVNRGSTFPVVIIVPPTVSKWKLDVQLWT